MNLSQGLIEAARIFPDHPALEFEGDSYSYAELDLLSRQAATQLRDAGVQPGDRVALLLANIPAFPVWYYGALRIGAIAVSVNIRLTAEEADFILSDSGSKILVIADTSGDMDLPSPERIFRVSEDGRKSDGTLLSDTESSAAGWLEMAPEDPAIILYTSGTTGFPKGATLSHENVRSNVHAFNHLCRMHPGDRLLLAVPLFHCYGQNALLNSGLNVGATIVMQRRFDLNEAKALIREHQVTKLFGVPTTFQLMLDPCSTEDLASIDYYFSAAATLAPQLGKAWQEKFGIPVCEGYGLTETAPFASYNHALKHVPGSIGMPIDLAEMKVVDPETGETCAPGIPGEIAVRGRNVMLGYWNKPEATAEAVRDGWFYSGDIGKVDEQGYFYIVDRIKDMVAVGGMKVFPSEVERILLDAPGVADCAVVGLPEPIWGEEVVAFVVPKDKDSTEAEPIRVYCLEHLAAYKVPSRVIFTDELPRNPAGKVLKKELREYRIDENDSDTQVDLGPAPENAPGVLLQNLKGSHAATRERMIVEHLQEEIRVLTGAETPPSTETALLETGLDSIMMVNLATRLQHQLGPELDLPATLVFDYPRIADLAQYLLEALEFQPVAKKKDQPESSVSGKSAPTSKPVEEMSDDEAMAALMEELND